MTRTEYTAALRKAGFTVISLWDTGAPPPQPAPNLTCYELFSAEGDPLGQMILHDLGDGDGVNAYFESRSISVEGDIDLLKDIAEILRSHAASIDLLKDIAEILRSHAASTAAREGLLISEES